MSINVGVIGAGGMAQYHIVGFRQAGAEVVAIADKYEPAAKAAAGASGNMAASSSVVSLRMNGPLWLWLMSLASRPQWPE